MIYNNEDSAVSDLITKIRDGSVQTLRIIYIAMAMGVIVFAGICIALFFKNEEAYQQTLEAYNFLPFLYVLGIICLTQYSILIFYPQLLFNRSFNESKALLVDKNKELNIEKAVMLARAFRIAVLAILEGSAFFGLVILINSILNFKIYSNSECWISVIPSIILVVYVILTFPQKETIAKDIWRRVITRLDNKII